MLEDYQNLKLKEVLKSLQPNDIRTSGYCKIEFVQNTTVGKIFRLQYAINPRNVSFSMYVMYTIQEKIRPFSMSAENAQYNISCFKFTDDTIIVHGKLYDFILHSINDMLYHEAKAQVLIQRMKLVANHYSNTEFVNVQQT